MKKILFFIFLLATFLNAKYTSNQEVLLLHSYHKGYKWSDDISYAIENKFKNQEHIELTTLYMDTKRVFTKDYLNELSIFYSKQLKNRNFDLVIASDNNAYDFAIQNKDTLFKDLPILFCGINNFDKELFLKNNYNKFSSGVVEQVDIERNFRLISSLHPNMRNLIIINDRSNTALAIKKDMQPIIEEYQKRFNIEYIDQMDIEQLKTKVKSLHEDDVLLFLLLFKDTSGEFFTYKRSFKQIKDVSNNPIYGFWDFYLDSGLVGGLLTSAKAQGDAVSDMALQILNYNVNVSDIAILEKSPNKFIFDYKELERFNISLEDQIANYEIINEPSSILREYTKFVVSSLFVILVMSIMIIAMRANIQRRKVVEEELLNQLSFEKVLLNTIPNAIYYKNKDGKLLGANHAFCNLFSVTRQEVIGKNAFDFFPKDIALKNKVVDQEILEKQITVTSEIALHFSNNEMKYFILKKSAYLDINGNVGGIVCIMDDVTQNVQQKQFLIQQSKLAEMGDMVAAIAHQWNEPLVELSALIQDMQTSYILEELKTKDVEEFVNDSMVQIKYMSQTLSDFRNFLKPSTTKTNFSLKKSIDDIFEIIGKQLFYCNVDIKINYSNLEDDFIIYGYKNEFKQVLLNILNNAKNEIMDTDDKNKNKINIEIYKNKKYNIIEISNNAGTIEQSILKTIFNPYFTTKKEGTGIGLYMAKVIIEDKMQGSIYAKNDGYSAVFTIKIPIKKQRSIEKYENPIT